MKLQIALPDELISLLGTDPDAKVREAVLLQLVHDGKISVAYAGQLLGLERQDAIRWYTAHGYSYPIMTPADLKHDLKSLSGSYDDRSVLATST
jgi:hypothetical protein